VLRYTKDDWADWNVTVETRMTFADKVREHFAVGCLGRKGGVGRLDPPASEPVAAANDVILKLPLTIIFYIYACHRKDLHLLSHFVRLTLGYCGILCSIRIDR
jgi:hypothetical protein